MEALRLDIQLYPDNYCYERAARLGVSPRGIRDAKKRLGVTYKENFATSQSGSQKKIYLVPKDPRTKNSRKNNSLH